MQLTDFPDQKMNSSLQIKSIMIQFVIEVDEKNIYCVYQSLFSSRLLCRLAYLDKEKETIQSIVLDDLLIYKNKKENSRNESLIRARTSAKMHSFIESTVARSTEGNCLFV